MPWVAKCSTWYWASLPSVAQRLDVGLGGLGAEQMSSGESLRSLATPHSSSAVSGSGIRERTSARSAWPSRLATCSTPRVLCVASATCCGGRPLQACLSRASAAQRRLPGPLARIAVEQRVAEADHRFGGGAGPGDAAQGFEGGDRGQHRDGMRACEPGGGLVVAASRGSVLSPAPGRATG